MADEGSVPRATVLEVLKAHGIDLAENATENPFPTVTAAAGVDPKGTLQVHALPDVLDRRMLHYLARKYSVPIHHFYNVDMIPTLPTAPTTEAPTKIVSKKKR